MRREGRDGVCLSDTEGSNFRGRACRGLTFSTIEARATTIETASPRFSDGLRAALIQRMASRRPWRCRTATANLFAAMGQARPFAAASFAPGETIEPGAEPVAVLSHRYLAR